MMPPAEELVALMTAAARAAGRAIMAVYAEPDIGVEAKADDSPVTRADLAAHDSITSTLSAACPQLPLLSEEGDLPPFDVRRQWQRYWLVDPLDGTKEFIRRSGEFTVNIALVEGGEAVLGVIYAPATNTLYAGQRMGQDRTTWRAWKINADGDQADIHSNPLAANASNMVVKLVASRDHGLDKTPALIGRLAAIWPQVEVKPMGSSLKMCLLAEGLADLYWRHGPTGEWDTAAAQAIVEAAGGGLFGMDGAPFRYNQRAGLTNPAFYAVGSVEPDWQALLADL
ncbi:MAG: hypothetical protein VR73_03190 [Gammaproteobacteria bacterium BRH_c0]|nr:MAG: hypothetical protein VR73_03190 [Gammaproteobacteria bacterium BRH_c0]